MAQAAHGRAPAVAYWNEKSETEMNVFTYQGDAWSAAIGTAEYVLAANRGEHMTVFFVNMRYMLWQGVRWLHDTAKYENYNISIRRDVNDIGYPIKVCELLNTLEAHVS
jgi:hypothetical protein